MPLDPYGAHRFEQLHTQAIQDLKKCRKFILIVGDSTIGSADAEAIMYTATDLRFAKAAAEEIDKFIRALATSPESVGGWIAEEEE